MIQNLDEIRRILRAAGAAGSGTGADPEPLDFLTVAMPRDAMQLLQQAALRARELGGSVNLSRCLDLICIDFLATNDFPKAGDPELKTLYLAKFAALFGVGLIAFDLTTGEPIGAWGDVSELDPSCSGRTA